MQTTTNQTLYIRAVTVQYFDYGAPLHTAYGLEFCTEASATYWHSFEEGSIIEKKRSIEACASTISLVEMPSIVRRIDLNPHGDI